MSAQIDVLAVLDCSITNLLHEDCMPPADPQAVAVMYEKARAAVAELIEADRLLDQCDAALESHRAVDTYGEAWAALQLQLHRARDFAANRRAAALANIGGAK